MLAPHEAAGMLAGNEISSRPYLFNKVESQGIVVNLYTVNSSHHHSQYLVVDNVLLVTYG